MRPIRPVVVDALARVVGRLAGGGSVIVSEYTLHPRARYGWEGQPPLSSLAALFDQWSADHLNETADRLAELEGWARSIPRHSERGPCWENDYWGSVDALWQVSALKERNPARYLEVGSGFSTLFARRAIEDFGLHTRITSIDPSPRREVDEACDDVVRQPLELTDLSAFAGLAQGDVVLVDGSHVVAMNSDAVVFLLEVLPSLPSGVLVGIDDVYLPWDYHPTWTSRGYGEQYVVAAYLLGGAAGAALRFPGWVAARSLADDRRMSNLWPVVHNRFGRLGSSLWLET
jgi:hypothetical protein